MPTGSRLVKPEELLTPGEGAVPEPVRRTQRFLRELGVWHRFTRNSPATSCKDAAHRRERLGRRGIPLWDELRSLAVRTEEGIALLHCRGDQQFDLAVASSVLGSHTPVVPLDSTVLESWGLGYGLVNPFHIWKAPGHDAQVAQVFDEGLLTRLGVPGSMMTNAGDRTWGVEFYPDELLRLMGGADSVRLAGIATASSAISGRPPFVNERRKIGIVTGNAPESGMALWQHTLDEVRGLLGRANRGDMSMPPVDVVSIPEMGLSMELDQRVEPVYEALSAAVTELCRNGCKLVAVACNTTQYFGNDLAELCAAHGTEFVSMPMALADWLRANQIRSVGLIGISYVSDLGEWSAYGPALRGFHVEIPSTRGLARIQEIAYQIKVEGPSMAALGRLLNVLRHEIDSPHVVLALTELSLLLNLRNSQPSRDKILIDPLKLYGQALARRYLGHQDTAPA